MTTEPAVADGRPPVRPAGDRLSLGAFLSSRAPLLAATLAAGALAGLVVLGGGLRIAMRILLITSGRHGVRTGNGDIAGRVTFGGTASLVLLGALIGTLVALLYLAIRRWVPGVDRWWHGPAFGVVTAAFLGRPLFVDPANDDFLIFTPVELGVSMFAALPFLYGMAFVALQRRFVAAFPRPTRRGRVVALYVISLSPLVGLLGTGPIALGAVLVVLAAWRVAASPATLARWRSRSVDMSGRVVLAGLVGLGSWGLVSAVSELLSAA